MSDIKDILTKLLEKKVSLEEAERLLKANQVEEVGDLAKLDIFRKIRTGTPEVIFAENKSPQMVLDITKKFLENKQFIIISRYNEDQKDLIIESYGRCINAFFR